MNREDIKLLFNGNSISLATSDRFCGFWNIREAAEALHDIMRSKDNFSAFCELYDTVILDEDDIFKLTADAEEICRISSGIGRIMTLDCLIGELYYTESIEEPQHARLAKMLHYYLMQEAYNDDAHTLTRIPATWLAWLTSGDDAGMTESELEEAQEWEKKYSLIAFNPDNVHLSHDVEILARVL
jgi:hypothetical protein